MTEHYWSFCSECGPMVICGTCGNNCCNGGYGPDGKGTCPDCPDAYLKQETEEFEYAWLDCSQPDPFSDEYTDKMRLLDKLFGPRRR